ncbi:carboxypeptidase regulatory-like domain-containing protein [Scytonema sp. NUACC26]|uniref:carboxypeptidase regulatory-like domain-containing protein n=1 Tax=Scytonema sp. NUACC26 TaxID=3140176 RepID=UPI0034DCAAB3
MLYLALLPAPPPIVMTVPPGHETGKASTENTLNSAQITKAPTQNSGIASRATAQSLVCKSLQTQLSEQVDSVLKTTTAKLEGKTVSCTPQQKKLNNLNLQLRLRQQKLAKGFSPNLTQPTLLNPPTIDSSTSSPNTVSSATVNTGSSEQPNPQQLTSALQKIAEKNTVGQILAAVQNLIILSLPQSFQDTNDTVVTKTNNSQQIASSTPQQTSSEVVTHNNQKAAPLSKVDTVPQINTNSSQQTDSQKLISTLDRIAQENTIGTILVAVQELINVSLPDTLKQTIDSTIQPKIPDSSKITTSTVSPSETQNATTSSTLQLARAPGEPFVVGVIINGREVGALDLIQEGNTLLIPLENFGDIAGFSIEETSDAIKVKTPLGVVQLSSLALKQINGITYITAAALQEELKISVELNTGDLTLLTDLPWRGGNRQNQSQAEELKPEFIPPSSLISNLRQELNLYRDGGDTSLRSSTLLGGRLLGWSWRARLDNTFEERPDLSEYFFYKRSGQFRFQVGRQQVGIHPLLNGLDLTGFQVGYSNLPPEAFSSTYSANELLPRRSRAVQTFRGIVPAASFVQLRVDGVIIAQQQVGFNGQYEFIDVNLPVGQSNQVEVLIYDRNNFRVPREIRSVRLNSSDLLLPSGGNVQLAGIGFNGNLAQDYLFENSDNPDKGNLVGFYQLRQGLSNNLTLEGSVQAAPSALQTQAGLIWRLANPVILSTSIGSSSDKIGYTADLDIQLKKLEINANSQSLPQGFRLGRNKTENFNHSLEVKYNFNNKYSLGFIARNRQDDLSSANYILPSFYARPFSTVSLSGRPDIDGKYLFNAFYQPNSATRLSFNTYGNAYISDLSYNFGRDYQLSFGTEFGGDLAPRYSVSVGQNPTRLNQLSWNLGLAYSDGEVGPIAGASLQVLPGLLARVEYQGIPTRVKSGISGFGDDRLTLSLISDLSFGGGRVAPANYSGIGKDRGAIAGRLVVEGENKNFNLSGTVVQVYDNRNKNVGSTRTDSKGNFFVGNLPEGIYIIQLEPEELPVELSVMKTSAVVQVATSAVTSLDFPIRPEFGVAGRVTDIAGQPVSQVKVELINGAGARVLSAMTDNFGLYRLDGVPVGFYTLRVSTQDSLNPNDSLPEREIQIRNQFVYEQNLQLPISAAAKKKS